MIQNDKPRVIVKNKNIQFIFDYCIESKTPFNASPRLSGDEWEIEFKITDVMGGVALGMFLRENRIEPVGIQVVKPQATVAAATATKTKASKTASAPKKQESEITEPAFAAPQTQPTFDSAPAVETTEASNGFEETETVETGGFSPEMLFDEN